MRNAYASEEGYQASLPNTGGLLHHCCAVYARLSDSRSNHYLAPSARAKAWNHSKWRETIWPLLCSVVSEAVGTVGIKRVQVHNKEIGDFSRAFKDPFPVFYKHPFKRFLGACKAVLNSDELQSKFITKPSNWRKRTIKVNERYPVIQTHC